MTSPHRLIESFETTTWIIGKQAEGLSHADTLLQPPFRGNCFNWVLGHIVENRDRVLAVLDEAPNLTEAEADVYRRGSEPVTEATAVATDKLLAAITDSQTRIENALQTADPARLAAIYSEKRNQTVAERIAWLHWHETYHTGQLELLRQLAGTDDAVIS